MIRFKSFLKEEKLKDGREIRITSAKGEFDKIRFGEQDTPVFWVRAYLDDKVIGCADFYLNWGTVENVAVLKGYRRLGVATALYNAIEKKWGVELSPSDNWIEKDGIEFWKKRDFRKIFKRT